MSAPQEAAPPAAAPPAEGAPASGAPANAPTAPAGGGQDYMDKGLDAIEKKVGQATGHNIDPAKYRSQNEKITDKIRGLIEKFTGKKMPSKVSN